LQKYAAPLAYCLIVPTNHVATCQILRHACKSENNQHVPTVFLHSILQRRCNFLQVLWLVDAVADGFPLRSTSLGWKHFEQRRRVNVIVADQTAVPPDCVQRQLASGYPGRRRPGRHAGCRGRHDGCRLPDDPCRRPGRHSGRRGRHERRRLPSTIVLRHAQGRRRQRGRRNSTTTRSVISRAVATGHIAVEHVHGVPRCTLHLIHGYLGPR